MKFQSLQIQPILCSSKLFNLANNSLLRSTRVFYQIVHKSHKIIDEYSKSRGSFGLVVNDGSHVPPSTTTVWVLILSLPTFALNIFFGNVAYLLNWERSFLRQGFFFKFTQLNFSDLIYYFWRQTKGVHIQIGTKIQILYHFRN